MQVIMIVISVWMLIATGLLIYTTEKARLNEKRILVIDEYLKQVNICK